MFSLSSLLLNYRDPSVPTRFRTPTAITYIALIVIVGNINHSYRMQFAVYQVNMNIPVILFTSMFNFSLFM